MAFNSSQRPGTLNLRGRGEYVNTKVRTSDRVISEQAEPRDYNPLRSDIWNLHKSSYKRISDLSHGEFHSTTKDALDRTVQERARMPLDRSHPLHVVRSFKVADSSLSKQLASLDTGALPTHPGDHSQHTMRSTYRDSFGCEGRQGAERQPRCQPQQTADKWMQFRRRKSWMYDMDQAPTQCTDDALTCAQMPKEVRACKEAAQDAGDAPRTADELEYQVAALQHKLAEERYPAEPNTERRQPADPVTSTDPAAQRQLRQSPQPTATDVQPAATAAAAAAEPAQLVTRDPPGPGEAQHRPSSYAAHRVPHREPQLHAGDEPAGPPPTPPAVKSLPEPCADPAPGADPLGDPGSSTRGPHPDDADAGRGQYVNLGDPDYPTAYRLARPCAPKEQDISGVFPALDTTTCRPAAAPVAPPPCPRTPVPCVQDPCRLPCPAVVSSPVMVDRYRSTYSMGYADPDAGLREKAAPRSARDLFWAVPPPPPLPLPPPPTLLAAGSSRCRDGLTRVLSTDVDPPVGPTTPAACEETVGAGEGLSGTPTPGRP